MCTDRAMSALAVSATCSCGTLQPSIVGARCEAHGFKEVRVVGGPRTTARRRQYVDNEQEEIADVIAL